MSFSATSLTGFFDKKSHQRILMLAFPMILSNITTPLIGLVDTAVLGHMGETRYLAGAAIGATIITQLYWLCGFLRMSATGLSAQALGSQNRKQAINVLVQGGVLSLLLALCLLMTQQPMLAAGVYFADAEPALAKVTQEYFSVRIWGAPAALLNLTLIGWLLGQQRSKAVLVIQILANLLNVVLNLLFVLAMDWGVKGVAMASVFAEVLITLLCVWLIAVRYIRGVSLSGWISLKAFKTLLGLNGFMLLRNLALQACLAFVTFQGARLGQDTVAVNAILMQFLTLIALGLDGVAFAVEALVGQEKGRKQHAGIRLVTMRGGFWSLVLACGYSLLFWCWGESIVALLTDHNELRELATAFSWVSISLPLIAHWCFLMDGVFVGLTRGKAMGTTMLISAVGVFFPVWWMCQNLDNTGLWLALLAFFLARGVTLGAYFISLDRENALTL